MKITEIYIKDFGKLRGVKIEPVDGINIIYGENESGKSTVMSFILSMLYGTGRGEQRHRYEPWSGSRMSGTLSFEHDGKEYTLSRQFGSTKAADKTELWCKTTGTQINLPGNSEPGEYLLEINRETFVNSVFIGQAGPAIHGSNNEILSKLTNLAATGDETASRTEISERLSDAASHLRSRRATAILPALEKQRQDLLEDRAALVKKVSQADDLRDEITKLSRRRDMLTTELEGLNQRRSVQDDIRRLKELNAIIEQKDSADEIRRRFDELDSVMFSGGSGLDHAFVEDSRALLEEYSSRYTDIKAKQERLEACEEKLEAIDTTPLEKYRIIRKYQSEIRDAFSEYTPLRNRKMELEQEIEEGQEKARSGKLTVTNAIIIGGAVTAIMLLLGILLKDIFYIFALIAAAITGAYVFFQLRGISFEGLPQNNIELDNIIADMRVVNRSIRPILQEMQVPDIEELDRELRAMDFTHNQIASLKEERSSVLDEIVAMRVDLDGVLQQLKDKLKPYTGDVESDEEVVKIISSIDKAVNEHASLEIKCKAEEEKFEALLAGRDFEQLLLDAEQLRERLGDRSRASADDEIEEINVNTAQDIDKCNEELSVVRQELVRCETQLGLLTTDPNDLNKLNEQIKLLTGRIDRYQFEYDAIQEAMSVLDDAFESMQKDFGPLIDFRAGKIVQELTGGKYSSVFIAENLVPAVTESGSSDVRSSNALSSGTVDQVYFALRLAIADILSSESLPLLLDDAFTQFDDKRMNDAMKYLIRETEADRLGQIIIFTCHERMLRASKSLGITDGFVHLK